MNIKNTLPGILLACTLLTGSQMMGQRFAETNPDFITWIPKTDTAPEIDGQLEDLWKADTAKPIEVLMADGVVDDAVDFSAVWYGLYDDAFFYVIIEVNDSQLFPFINPALWPNDRIELYYNMDNVKPAGNARTDDNYQYSYGPDESLEALVSGSGSLAGHRHAVGITDTGYILEIKIPFVTLTTLEMLPGSSFGFDIAISDNDGGDTYEAVHYWWTSNNEFEWSNLDGAGTVGLLDPDAATWRGLPGIDGYYDTGTGLGWVYAEMDPWVYVVSLPGWAYMPPEWSDLSTTQSGWVWFLK